MKNEQLIAKFSYNNKNFEIFFDNQKFKCRCFDENGKLYSNLPEKEKIILSNVIKSLIIDVKSSSYVRDDYANGRLYKIYYDSKSKNYFWKSNEGVDIASDNAVLNMKYNHMPSVIYHKRRAYHNLIDSYHSSLDDCRKSVNNYYKNMLDYYNVKRLSDITPKMEKEFDSIYLDEDEYYQKYVYVKSSTLGEKIGKFISVLVKVGFALGIAATLSYAALKYTTIIENLPPTVVATIENENAIPTEIEIKLEENKDTEIEDTYGYFWIKTAIERNPYLTDVEKSFLYELKFVFDEYHQYMDLDMIMSRLYTLRINYTNEPYTGSLNMNGGTIGGIYNLSENYIEFYENSTSFADVSIYIFLHEFFHVLQCPSNAGLTRELSNELFTIEAFKRLDMSGVLDKFRLNKYYPGGYLLWMNRYYNLAEILSQETLCRFQFQGGEGLLISDLMKSHSSYQKDLNMAWGLIDMINDSTISEEITNAIYDSIDHFYKLNNNNTSMEENLNYFANNNLHYKTSLDDPGGEFFLEILGKSQYLEYADCIILWAETRRKTYFSDTFPETTIHIEFDGHGKNSNQGIEILKANGDYRKEYVIVIDDELKEKYSKYVTQNYNNGMSK